jgi:hypothetical protein
MMHNSLHLETDVVYGANSHRADSQMQYHQLCMTVSPIFRLTEPDIEGPTCASVAQVAEVFG